jgi:hypothetical protein
MPGDLARGNYETRGHRFESCRARIRTLHLRGFCGFGTRSVSWISSYPGRSEWFVFPVLPSCLRHCRLSRKRKRSESPPSFTATKAASVGMPDGAVWPCVRAQVVLERVRPTVAVREQVVADTERLAQLAW